MTTTIKLIMPCGPDEDDEVAAIFARDFANRISNGGVRVENSDPNHEHWMLMPSSDFEPSDKNPEFILVGRVYSPGFGGEGLFYKKGEPCLYTEEALPDPDPTIEELIERVEELIADFRDEVGRQIDGEIEERTKDLLSNVKEIFDGQK